MNKEMQDTNENSPSNADKIKRFCRARLLQKNKLIGVIEGHLNSLKQRRKILSVLLPKHLAFGCSKKTKPGRPLEPYLSE
jgi:hypothetical protein